LASSVVFGLAGCAPKPYLVLKGPPAATFAVSSVSVQKSGIVVGLSASDCSRESVEHWCPLTNPSCTDKPLRVTREHIDCPPRIPVSLKVRAPWGEVYAGSGDVAHVEVPVDWSKSGIDPLAANAAASLRDGWFAQTTEGGMDQALKPSDDDLTKMVAEIGDATDTQVETNPDARNTKLLVAFAESNAANVVGLSVTNTGDTPAYRVVATLRSSFRGAHGLQISFGRIDPQRSKVRARQIPPPTDPTELSPTIVAEVTAQNSTAISVSRRITLERAKQSAALAIACADPNDEVGPGQRTRLECEVSNPNAATAMGLSYVVTAGTAATPTSGPRELKGHDKVKLKFFVAIPSDAKSGSTLPIAVTISGTDLAPATGKAAAKIANLTGGCTQAKLSREEYLTKRKRLHTALASGALTQEEFDKYDAALVACIQ